MVRNVAPNKDMFCLTFVLPESIAVSPMAPHDSKVEESEIPPVVPKISNDYVHSELAAPNVSMDDEQVISANCD